MVGVDKDRVPERFICGSICAKVQILMQNEQYVQRGCARPRARQRIDTTKADETEKEIKFKNSERTRRAAVLSTRS